MKHPIVLAAKAAYAELSSEAAKQFFKDTALQHIGLTVFYLSQAVFYAVEAGKMTRTLVEGWRTTETVSETTESQVKEPQAVIGLLPPAQALPTTTQAAKLEQYITKNIQGNYDQIIQDQNVQDGGSDCDQSDRPCLELVQEPSLPSPSHQDQDNPAPARRKAKPNAGSGRAVKADDTKTTGRVPRSRRQVSAQ